MVQNIFGILRYNYNVSLKHSCLLDDNKDDQDAAFAKVNKL